MTSGTAEHAEPLERLAREPAESKRHPPTRIRHAGVLLVVDRSGPSPRVLMGQRHAKLAFLANRVVFPGGRVEPADYRLRGCPELLPAVDAALRGGPGPAMPAGLPRALALAAIRETAEETGVMLGQKAQPVRPNKGPWNCFAGAGIVPAVDRVHFFARAITPPGRPRRFDTRFFLADACDLANAEILQTDSELGSVAWHTFEEARAIDLHRMTRIVLDEAESRLDELSAGGMRRPLPYFRHRHRRFERHWIPVEGMAG